MRRRFILVVAVAFAVPLVGGPMPASADWDAPEIKGIMVATFDDGVRIEASRRSDGAAGTGSDPDRPPCFLEPYDYDSGYDLWLFGPRPSPEAEPFVELCDGVVSRYLWIAPDVSDPELAVRGEAERLARDVLKPGLVVGMNPPGRGLVGFPSWFWVEGFDGLVESGPIEAFGTVVEVRLSTGQVIWDFGDGSGPVTGDLGRAYPRESSVRHVFAWHGDYTVGVRVELVAAYRVDGGDWQALDPLVAEATGRHSVEQRQAVITHIG